MSLSIGLDLGLRSLLNSQGMLQTIGNNLANAATPGYSRQDVLFMETRPLQVGTFAFGQGVDIAAVRRIVDESVEARLREQGSILARLTTERAGYLQLEGIVAGGGASSLTSMLGSLFDAASSLAAHPADGVDRQNLLTAGDDLASALRELAKRIGKVRGDASIELEVRVKEVNVLAEQVASLNHQIAGMKSKGLDAHALEDTRNVALQDLGALAGVTTIANPNGSVSVLLEGHTIVSGKNTFELQIKKSAPGAAPTLRVKGSVGEVAVGEGAIAGLLKIGESEVPSIRQRADAFAHALALAWNRVHSTGLPKSGGFSILVAGNAVADPDAPLSQAGLPFDVTGGDLYVNVTDPSTGGVTKTRLAIDPNGSLADFAAQLNGVAGLNASIDGGVLRISADAGLKFDFSPRLDPNPGSLGTSAAEIGGLFSGKANDAWEFRALGDGTVGVTPGLQVGVYDSAGALVSTLDVGEGYSAGDPLVVRDGVTVSFGEGAISSAAGDLFSLDVVADADTSDVLVGLGLNSFFTGSDASDIAIREDLLANPDLVAAAIGDAEGDGANALRMLTIGDDASLAGLDGSTLSSFLNGLTADSGFDAKRSLDLESSQQSLVFDLVSRREEISGVSLEEEMANLVRFQQQFEAAGRYIQTVQELSGSLLELLQ